MLRYFTSQHAYLRTDCYGAVCMCFFFPSRIFRLNYSTRCFIVWLWSDHNGVLLYPAYLCRGHSNSFTKIKSNQMNWMHCIAYSLLTQWTIAIYKSLQWLYCFSTAHINTHLSFCRHTRLDTNNCLNSQRSYDIDLPLQNAMCNKFRYIRTMVFFVYVS